MKTIVAIATICLAGMTGCTSKSVAVAVKPAECHDIKQVSVYPVQNGHYQVDPAISALISSGEYSVLAYDAAPGGTCMVTVRVEGILEGEAYNRTVRVIGL